MCSLLVTVSSGRYFVDWKGEQKDARKGSVNYQENTVPERKENPKVSSVNHLLPLRTESISNESLTSNKMFYSKTTINTYFNSKTSYCNKPVTYKIAFSME